MWLNGFTPDSVVFLNGFTLVRADRKVAESSKRKDEGQVVFVNDRWCNLGLLAVKEQTSRGNELRVISIKPY